MKYIDEIKKIMYDKNTSYELSGKLNEVIYLYDKDRAKNEQERLNAGKEWEYRLKRYCEIKERV